jgi:hypothetical protein
VFPADRDDLLAAEILAARQIGLRFHPGRGSMNLGESAGGLPPDSVVEQHDDILAATQAAIDRWHDPLVRRDDPDRGRAVLTVLGHGRAHARQRRAGPAGGCPAAHPPGRDHRRGSAVLAAVPELCEVRLALPNKHHFVVDLAPFGLANEDEVYYAADRPYGLIEGTVLADDAPDPGIAWS